MVHIYYINFKTDSLLITMHHKLLGSAFPSFTSCLENPVMFGLILC